MTEILTAQTERGQATLEEVLAQSYRPDLSKVSPEWTRVLVHEGVPTSFIAIDPGCAMAYPGGEVPYAHLVGGATRGDRRGRGHFRRLLEDTCEQLQRAGGLWLVGRLPYRIGRALGFRAFTHHSVFQLPPEEIEQTLGGGRPEGAEGILRVAASPNFQEDLLVIADAKAADEEEAVKALRGAAWAARSSGKAQILFEHPPVAVPGERYPIHATRHTPLLVTAMICHARVRVSGSEVDEAKSPSHAPLSPVVHADMVRLLNLPRLLERVLAVLEKPECGYPAGSVAFDTDVGKATLSSGPNGWQVADDIASGAHPIPFTPDLIAQVIAGYRSVETLAYLHQVGVPKDVARFVDTIFPRFWRFSRSGLWVYKV
jgi:hypothetical protein